MKSFKLLIATFILSSCATSTKVLESDFQKLSTTHSGAVLTVNLQTNGRVREDKECFLKINDGVDQYELLLKRGVNDYALPIMSENKIEITKITCGPFYYYDLKNQGADFHVKSHKIKYLGYVNFKFEDKGELEWGHASKDKNELLKRVQMMGFEEDIVEIDLLKL